MNTPCKQLFFFLRIDLSAIVRPYAVLAERLTVTSITLLEYNSKSMVLITESLIWVCVRYLTLSDLFFSDGTRDPCTDNNWTGTYDSLISMCRNDLRGNFTTASITLVEEWGFTGCSSSFLTRNRIACYDLFIYLFIIRFAFIQSTSLIAMIQNKHMIIFTGLE